MNVLVTGGLGFIGSAFVNEMYERYPLNTYYVIDCYSYAASEDNLKVPVQIFREKIQNTTFVLDTLQKCNINIIVHFAAESFVDASFVNSKLFIDNNIIGTHSLLEAAKEYNKLTLFLNMSTDEVYGSTDAFVTEKSPLIPTNPYAASKASAELLATSYFFTHTLPIITVRCNNVFGENQYVEKLVPRFIDLLKRNEKCTIHGKGTQLRSFIHTSDLNNALDLIINKGTIGEIYNIGTKDEYSVLDIARLLVKFIHNTHDFRKYISFVSDRVYNDSRYLVDTTKIEQLGWKNTCDFESTLELLTREF